MVLFCLVQADEIDFISWGFTNMSQKMFKDIIFNTILLCNQHTKLLQIQYFVNFPVHIWPPINQNTNYLDRSCMTCSIAGETTDNICNW